MNYTPYEYINHKTQFTHYINITCSVYFQGQMRKFWDTRSNTITFTGKMETSECKMTTEWPAN